MKPRIDAPLSGCFAGGARPLQLIGGGLESGAPLPRVEPRWGGLLEEAFEYRDEPRRRFQLRKMADPVEDLKTAAGYRVVCALAVADGDDRIALPPHDQDGEAASQV